MYRNAKILVWISLGIPERFGDEEELGGDTMSGVRLEVVVEVLGVILNLFL